MKALANWMILRANFGAFFFAVVLLALGSAARNASAVTLYWDNDTNAANNNITTGTGLGGTGNWDTSSSKWFNGASDVAWTDGSDAVFWGNAGTVTLNTPPSANSVTFHSTGYVVLSSPTSNALTLTGPVSVDTGVADTIQSLISGTAGLVKNGAGALHLAWTANNYTGGTIVNGGTLGFVGG